MKNPIGHGAADFGFGPGWVTSAKTRGEELAHGAVHPDRLLQPLFGGHSPDDRELTRLRSVNMIGLSDGRHAAKVTCGGDLATSALPAISLRCGFSTSGLPIGLQISGSVCGKHGATSDASCERDPVHTPRPEVPDPNIG